MATEFLDHTGDVGIVVTAPSVEALFAEAATAMFAILAEAVDPRPAGHVILPVPSDPTAEDLRDFLADLLGRFSVDQLMYVAFTPGAGNVEAAWESYDAQRHPLRTELKGVTYHQLRLDQGSTGWTAQVIFDV